eukprot:TRINITY_DN26988_c1_g5_i1.p1 TRINITY_DN26988_c1_g5~~TRINITY_DN26988_c1_g5_i1.p1  ORF type:complete len:801 (-),score=144.95 TRINITY_DN26988_c1_g5_i1:161-2563(-)
MGREALDEAASFGPHPLVRPDEKGQLRLQDEGLALLRELSSPVHVVFAIGGSRCGKSTACNALSFGASSASRSSRFETGDTFEPVTTGVDVAVHKLASGGALVVADCEGAFHACGSAQSARGFGPLGLLAYRVCSVLLHVSMGSIDERDIEALGFLAASAEECLNASTHSEKDKLDAIKPPAVSPDTPRPFLALLVNGARFDLGDAVARRLLRIPEPGSEGAVSAEAAGSRGSARSAIARGFCGHPALESLPACEHAAYWSKVNTLRNRLLDAPPSRLPNGAPASGAEISNMLVEFVAQLNGETLPAAATREPESATEVLYRNQRLEPLVEELSRKFAAEGAGDRSGAGNGKSEDGNATTVDEVLAEFDRRASQAVGSVRNGTGEGEGGGDDAAGAGAAVREGLIAEMRARLSSRLAGINEALARGKQQAKERRRRNSGAGLTSSEYQSSSRASSPPGSPSNKKALGALSKLEAKLNETHEAHQQHHARTDQMLNEMKAACKEHESRAAAFKKWLAESDRQHAMEDKHFQDRAFERVRIAGNERSRCFSTQASKASSKLTELQVMLNGSNDLHPELGKFKLQLTEMRESLEAGRLQRHEISNAATKAVDARLRAARETFEAEAGALAAVRARVTTELETQLDELRARLEGERKLRRERHNALVEVVDRLTASLEAHAEPLQSPDTPRGLSVGSSDTPSATAAPLPVRRRQPGDFRPTSRLGGMPSEAMTSSLSPSPSMSHTPQTSRAATPRGSPSRPAAAEAAAAAASAAAEDALAAAAAAAAPLRPGGSRPLKIRPLPG